jgi:hypothetical protein
MIGRFRLDSYDTNVRGAFISAYIAKVVNAIFVKRVRNQAIPTWYGPSKAIIDSLYRDKKEK